MHSIYELVTLEVQNEHNYEHDLEHRPLFNEPKIYDADGDLNKRWYVYFSYRNPKTGKLERMKNIYGTTNKFKTKADRYSLLRVYKKRLSQLLREGYDPFVENTENHRKMTERKNLKVAKKESEADSIPQPVQLPVSVKENHEDKNTGMNIIEALNRALQLKTNIVGERTLIDYKSRCHVLGKWLKKNHKDIKTVDQLNKKVIVDFLNHVQLTTSPRNRNNYRVCFGSIFQALVDNDIMQKNCIREIGKLPTKPKRNKSYTHDEQEAIFKHMEDNDPTLLLFVKFISYNFLRPLEVCRLKVGDIDIKQKQLVIKVKTKDSKIKIIPDILLEDLPDLSKMNPADLLFTPKGIGGTWDAQLTNRRNYFTERFRKVVKDELGFGVDYGLYSFRHTFITKLYRALEATMAPFAAMTVLMGITGHTTMDALKKYLRDVDAELPKDYSKLLR